MSPTRITAAVLALVLMFGLGIKAGITVESDKRDADTYRLAKAATELKEAWNDDIATQRQRQADEVRAINARLADALDRLRQRPARMPEPAREACKGSTGAELSGDDAGFLVREAARADELREALRACYGWIETVTGH
jgi:hypothetical protein